MNKILVICGPTATGKSDLAVKLARKFNGEIISADSRQVYRGLNIGSGKVSDKEKRGVIHYLLDVVSPKRRFSSAEFAVLAKKAVEKIIEKNKLVIVCGGTGFYIQTLIDNLETPQVKPDWILRKKLEKLDLASLQKQLQRKDLKRWERMNKSDRQNSRRLIRALEIIEKTGKAIPDLKRHIKNDLLMIGITSGLDILKKRIEERLTRRLKQGMIEEIKDLVKSGVTFTRLDEMGLEYRWLGRYQQGKINYEEMEENLFKDIYAFAKRQMTWFRKDKRIKWFDIAKQNWQTNVEAVVDQWYNANYYDE